LDFVLAPGKVFDRFSCQVAIHPAAGPKGAVAFVVAANGKPLIRTKPLKTGDPPLTIQVALPRTDVLTLSLRTIAGSGSTPSHNLATWANPTLHKSGN
ncbi:MAG: NPCBM/NEW2 domain-containing protein, partial [Planctomycetota bacterium]|nr:NPCBM/NEW2 domain-containing protein [Planctomycetota bacterium]